MLLFYYRSQPSCYQNNVNSQSAFQLPPNIFKEFMLLNWMYFFFVSICQKNPNTSFHIGPDEYDFLCYAVLLTSVFQGC